MTTHTIAKTSAWCLNCPNTIQPGDEVLLGPEYAKPGTDRQPMIHARCEGLPEWDPDVMLPILLADDDEGEPW